MLFALKGIRYGGTIVRFTMLLYFSSNSVVVNELVVLQQRMDTFAIKEHISAITYLPVLAPIAFYFILRLNRKNVTIKIQIYFAILFYNDVEVFT